jgi:DNA-binding NarL/FixJ family response regulator
MAMATDRPIRVMMVEDEGGFRRMLALLLESASDVELVALAINGAEAVRSYAVHQPDIVLIDIDMPVMDGIEATKAICRDLPQARIILFSAHHNLLYPQTSADVGAAGKLARPLRLGTLLRAIHNVHRELTVDGQAQ